MSNSSRGPLSRVLWGGLILAGVAAAIVVFLLAHAGGHPKQASVSRDRDAPAAAAEVQRGLHLQHTGQIGPAERAFRNAVALDAKNVYAVFDLGALKGMQGEAASARRLYERALALNPRFEPALYNLAVLRQREGDVAGALPLYQQAVQANPSDANAHYNLALLLRAMPKYRADGDAQMKIAIDIDPKLKDPLDRKR